MPRQKQKVRVIQNEEQKVVQIPEKSRSEIVRTEILNLREKVETGYVDLALLLSEAYTEKMYITWGYDDFSDYTQRELDTKYRKAMYFVEIGEKITSLGLPKERIAKIGWTKLKDLIPVLTTENVDDWLGKAESMTSRELAENVHKVRIGSGDVADRPSITKITLTMSESEANIIMSAIEEAKNIANNDNTVVALEMIAHDWLEAQGTTPTKTSLQDHVKYLETIYAVKITVVGEDAAVMDDLKKEATLSAENDDELADLLD